MSADDEYAEVPEAEQGANAYSMSPGLARWLGESGHALAVSSYQSGKFYLLGRNPQTGGLMVHERLFRKAMGIATPRPGSLWLATLYQLTRFENVLREGERANALFDACFVPRATHVTGAVDAHDVGELADGRPVFVNTAYNCLATLSQRHSFELYWMPPFIDALVKEDRCHLNGLAMDGAEPAYVTACSRSNMIDGWRDRRNDGGVVIDVRTNEIVCSGLSMPHSPRLHEGRLHVLNSGRGELGWVDLDKSPEDAFTPIASCPGFARGLALAGNMAVVGLSKPRYERFEGLELDRKLREADSEAWCAVQVIDLTTGTCLHWFRIDGAVSELYDVGIVPGTTCPMALGFASDEIMNMITFDAPAR